MVADLLTDGLLNLVPLELKQLIFDDVVLLEFVPIFLPLVEQNRVSKMEKGSVVGAEVFVHHSFVNDDLLSLLAISSIVVKLEGFDEFVLIVGIPLVCLNNWHASLVGLDNVHG